MATGIGGQGIQLLAKTLALGAVRQGRHAMLSAEVGGEMRGGPSLASVVIGDSPVKALPIFEEADSIILSHHRHSERARERLVPGGLVVVNSDVVDRDVIPSGADVLLIPAVSAARELGAPQAQGLIMLGAFAARTGIVEIEHLGDAMESLLPPYRAAAAPSNRLALQRGHALALQEAHA
ncbi:MAG: 2-oxoacid:acceptor oxidoreductase family protein [Tetrasphaera sp.]|nr:2-oxoacid:acceptor oxidoreductase family protein [Tetrasphaera sp.]